MSKKLTQEYLHELFEYKDGELYWKEWRRNPAVKSRSKRAGKKAGSINTSNPQDGGRTWIETGGKMYTVASLIFMMFHGYIPPVVNHIDRNPQNTNIENLRAADRSQQLCTAKMRSNNLSGYKGVSYNKRSGSYFARAKLYGVVHHKYGFKTAAEAHEAYCKMAKELHGEFARFD